MSCMWDQALNPNTKRTCKYCKKRKLKSKGYLVQNISFFCDTGCAAKHGLEKARKDTAKKLSKAKREIIRRSKGIKKKNLKQRLEFELHDVKLQHKRTKPVFNKLRRLQEFEWFRKRGVEPYCISCGKTDMDWCCGHFKTVAASGHIRYDVKNTYLQCNRYCNKGLSGNINGNKTSRGYLKGLEIRFGAEKAKEIIAYCEINYVKKWTGIELDAMRKGFNKQTREIER